MQLYGKLKYKIHNLSYIDISKAEKIYIYSFIVQWAI